MLRDPARVRRGAQAVSWHPDGLGRLAVAYSVLEFQRQPEGMPTHSYVWDVANPNTPEATLAPPIPLVRCAGPCWPVGACSPCADGVRAADVGLLQQACAMAELTLQAQQR